MVIKTKRLILRLFLEADAADVYEYLKEPAVNCFAGMKLRSLDEAREEMKKCLEEIEYYFVTPLKEGARSSARSTSTRRRESPMRMRTPRDTFGPCWILNEAYQGKEHAFEAAPAFFDHFFSQKGARRIYAYTEDYNLASQHMCEKLGMRRESVFLEFISFVNNPHGTPMYENTVQYVILKKEWD